MVAYCQCSGGKWSGWPMVGRIDKLGEGGSEFRKKVYIQNPAEVTFNDLREKILTHLLKM